MERRKDRVSQPIGQRSPLFLGPWICLTWSSSYVSHPKEYFKALQEENRQRDMTGWRRISRLKLPLKKDLAIERCTKGGSRHIRKQRNDKKKKGRPAAGTAEAKSQTAAACEANRKRRASKRKK
jgi:hypothetical protein